MSTNKPDLTRVWANGAPPANVVDPDTTTPGKVNSGWQAEVPPFEHFNFLQKWFSQGLAHNNEQGINVWDTETTYPINGLAKGSNGRVYRATFEQSGNDPIANPSVWKPEFNIDQNLILQIGSGGDYETIGEAIRDLSSLSVVYSSNPNIPPVILNLKSGFVMDEQVFVKGLNLGFIEITSDDAEVVISRSALTQELGSFDTARPAFGGVNCVMPVINVQFNMDTSGSELSRRDGLFVENGKALIKPGAGFKNCGEVGAYANSGSEIQAEGTDMSGCNVYGFFSFKGSSINCQSATANDCGQYGLYVNRTSKASANYATFNNAGVDAIRAVRASSVSWEDGVGTGAAEKGIYALASTVFALRADVSGAGKEGIYSHDGAIVGFREGKADNCGGFGAIWAYRGGMIDANAASANNFKGTTAAVLAQRASTINFQEGSALNSAAFGVASIENSRVNAKEADVSGSVDTGVLSNNASSVCFLGGVAVNCGGVASIYANNLSSIDAASANVQESNGSTAAVLAQKASTINFQSGVAVNCGGVASIYANSSSTIAAELANVQQSDGTHAAVLAQRASTINFQNGDCSNGGTTTRGVRSSEGSNINALSANAQIGGTPSANDVSVYAGGTVTFKDGTGGVSNPVNTVQSEGIIFQ